MRVSVVLWCNVWLINMRWERVKGNPVTALAYSFRKTPMGTPGLTSPSDGRISINNTCLHIIFSAEGFGTYTCISGTETSDWGSAPQFLLVPRRNLINKNSQPARDQTRDCCVQAETATAEDKLWRKTVCGWDFTLVRINFFDRGFITLYEKYVQEKNACLPGALLGFLTCRLAFYLLHQSAMPRMPLPESHNLDSYMSSL